MGIQCRARLLVVGVDHGFSEEETVNLDRGQDRTGMMGKTLQERGPV